jgi:hypothetical protein
MPEFLARPASRYDTTQFEQSDRGDGRERATGIKPAFSEWKGIQTGLRRTPTITSCRSEHCAELLRTPAIERVRHHGSNVALG